MRSILITRKRSTGSLAYSWSTSAITARCHECSASFSRRRLISEDGLPQHVFGLVDLDEKLDLPF